jgi:hypothetical protein
MTAKLQLIVYRWELHRGSALVCWESTVSDDVRRVARFTVPSTFLTAVVLLSTRGWKDHHYGLTHRGVSSYKRGCNLGGL